MKEKSISRNKNISIPLFIYFAVFSFGIMAICSQCSFLYPFTQEPDVNCFYTVARCILNGKVLYRDVYEHKGLYVYFLYAIAYFISDNSYIGVYILESIFATVFMCFSYLICYKLTGNRKYSEIASIICCIVAYTSIGFQEGGFVEEYSIPFISIILYLAVTYYKEIYPKRIPFGFVFCIGILTGIMFWMKYTMIGCVVGLGLYVFYSFMRDKNYKALVLCFIQLLFGFCIASLPMVLYFGYNHAFSDMVKVYFYTLLFDYKESKDAGLGEMLRILLYGKKLAIVFLHSGLFLYGFVFYFWIRKKKEEWVECLKTVSLTTVVIVSYGMIYYECYQVLVLYPFFIFAFVALYETVCSLSKEKDKVWRIRDGIIANYYYLMISIVLLFGVLCSFGTWENPFIIFLLFLITECVFRFGQKIEKITWIRLKREEILALKYLCYALFFMIGNLISGKVQIEYQNVLSASAFVSAFRSLLMDWNEISVYISKYCVRKKSVVDTIKKTFQSNVGYICYFVCSVVFVLLMSRNTPFMFCRYENTPQYKFAKYISEAEIENPIIIHHDTMDMGIYNVLHLLPQMRYYTYYCLDNNETEASAKEWIGEGKVDYIITASPIVDEELYADYKLVLTASPYYTSGNLYQYYLFERK